MLADASSYDALKYSRGGSYGTQPQQQAGYQAGPQASFSQNGTQSHGYSYNSYQPSSEQTGYSYGQQGQPPLP